MTNDKDIKDKDVKDTRVSTRGLYERLFLKVEKLASALYMVTDFLSDSEPLKWKLRSRSIDLLTDTAKHLKDTERLRGTGFDNLVSEANEIVSLLSVAYTSGAVSKMNFEILKQEYEALATQMFQAGFGQTLSQYLVVPAFEGGELLPVSFTKTAVRENSYGMNRPVSPENFDKRPDSAGQVKRIGQKDTGNDLYGLNSNEGKKSIRKEQIISWLKDKSWTSIAEIAKALPDCGPKTVQRELLDLVSLGVLKKQGERRWSRYMLA